MTNVTPIGINFAFRYNFAKVKIFVRDSIKQKPCNPIRNINFIISKKK